MRSPSRSGVEIGWAADLTRRTFTQGVAGVTGMVAVTGCRAGGGTPPIAPPVPEPDQRLFGVAARDEQAVLDQLTRVAARFPGLAVHLEPSMKIHRAHLRVLADQAPGASPLPSPPRRPGSRAEAAAAVARVSRAELRLRAGHARAAAAARSGELARLLASLGAAAAQQAVVLNQLTATLRLPRPAERP